MGKEEAKPFVVKHPRILDCSTSTYRSDFLDIWLFANCYFAISCGTGIYSAADVIRTSVVCVNYVSDAETGEKDGFHSGTI